MPITSFSQLDLTKQYSYADYLAWEIKIPERLEIINGIARRLETPWIPHHLILNEFFFAMYSYFKGNTDLEMWRIPFHLYLTIDKNAQANEINNVIQPDIFVCKKEIVGEWGVTGVP